MGLLAFGFIIRRLLRFRNELTGIWNPGLIMTVLWMTAVNSLLWIGNALCYKNLAAAVSEEKIPTARAVLIYCRANLLKYLPGNIFHLVGRNQLAEETEAGHAQVAFCTTLEMICTALSGVVITLLFAGPQAFLELKKKYKGVVYKRRISLPLSEAEAYMDHRIPLPQDSQIGKEIEWACHMYHDLGPAAHISYDRNAWFDLIDPELRLTFDRNILWQTEDLSLSSLPFGHSLLNAGESLLEIKTATSIPMWLVSVLNDAEIRQTSFSKYGSVYTAMLTDNRMRGVTCA